MTSKSEESEKKSQPRRRGKPIEVWVSDEEKEAIAQKADQAGLSRSAYLRALGLEKEINSRVDLTAIKELVKVNGDFGRMGGLLKMWLTERNPKNVTCLELEGVMKKCREMQAEMLKIMPKIAK